MTRFSWSPIAGVLLNGVVLIVGLGSGDPVFAQSGTKSERSVPAMQPPPRPRDIGSTTGAPSQAPPAEPAIPQQPSAPEAQKSEPAREPPGESACMRMLRAVHGKRIRVSDAKMPTDLGCQVVDPVVVTALALRSETGPGQVAFDPPVTIGCAMAQRVAEWLDTSVQPLAQGHFDRDLAGLRVGGGHECRRRNRGAAGPLSEHSTGQALDIFAFQLGKPKPDPARRDDAKADGLAIVVEKPDGLAQDRFMAAIRQSACGAFTTSLGPGSDAAHANHLHVDIQERRSRSTRFCQ